MTKATAPAAKTKGKLAIYWAASCGGCEIAILGIDAKILDVDAAFDLVLCPCIADGKVHDIENLPDRSIDVCLFNGGVRTSEQEYMAQLLRRKSKVLVAFGSCASEGGIPGLGNMHDRKSIFDTVYKAGSSTAADNPRDLRPQHETQVPEGTLSLPVFYDTLKTLAQTVEVDYYLPGCPPEADKIWAAIEASSRASCRRRARSWASRRPSARSASGRGTKRRSRSSTAPGRRLPMRKPACWSRASSVAASPRGPAAGPSARKSIRPASAATAPTRASTVTAHG